MPFVQFRVHPGVGCARMGNSKTAYHLASEFPYFLQEDFPNLRFKPKPRTHPRGFFANDTDQAATGTIGPYAIYHADPAFQNKFKEAEGVVFPQAARFRVFAYVYDKETKPRPSKVFEVTTAHADISWTVKLGNKKSARKHNTPNPAVAIADPFENIASDTLETSTADLVCKRLRANADIPNLGYLFLERNDGDKTKVNGRLHVIGNEGEFAGDSGPSPGALWSDDWYDSAADGSVTATIKPKPGNALRTAAGASSVANLKYLSYGTDAALNGDAASIEAMPAWVVVGCPDYAPDMGHFISLWDMALSRGIVNVEKSLVATQTGKHKFISSIADLDDFKKVDYRIHIHPLLCLFDDIRFVSGEAFGQPEYGTGPFNRAHESNPGDPVPPPEPLKAKTLSNALERGGAFIKARASESDLANPAKLKVDDPTRPIAEWLKVAIHKRLRKPITVYDQRRRFRVSPAGVADTYEITEFPRRLGRRMDYDKAAGAGSLKGKFYDFIQYDHPRGNLREWHGLSGAASLCGGLLSPPAAGPPGMAPLSPADKTLLELLDDMYWPATFSDMPMLRELAFTPIQYKQFEIWQAAGAGSSASIYNQILTGALKRSFAAGGDGETNFADFLKARPLFAPSMIDIAHLGAMLGGSFLPGIEVGREGGISTNWSLFHGATSFFPSIRFKPSDADAEPTVGTLTKDLAVPWSEDFQDCDETFWPTSRPGMVTKDGTARIEWMMDPTDSIPHLHGPAGPRKVFVKEYWKALGFIRRTTLPDGTLGFVETEQTWH